MHEGQIFVLVFMYCDPNRFGALDELASVLHSVRFPTKKPR
jgi:hypothetical protein